MTWLVAVVLRPFAALLLFGFAAFVAMVVIKPLIPKGRVKDMLFDRTLQKRYPWRFAILAIGLGWGVPALIGWYVYTR
jgi:hypothetical protein